MSNKGTILCPAHRCQSGSQLLGGTKAILPQTLPIDEFFIQKVKQHAITPERRYCFTNKCIEGGCKQWNGKDCNVTEKVVQFLDGLPIQETLPTCSIRNDCRWYIQKRDVACKTCSLFVTEVVQQDFEIRF